MLSVFYGVKFDQSEYYELIFVPINKFNYNQQQKNQKQNKNPAI
jgi:hypothetical protein